jgi:hypothetical protein
VEANTGNPSIDLYIQQIAERRLPTGGFSENLHGLYHPDSTAWAILALARIKAYASIADSARWFLAANQQNDGRIALSNSRDAFWPTPIAVLAWHGAGQFDQAKKRALDFLLATSGKHWRYDPKSPVAHDTSIKGWPWIGETHSFVDPTATALLALDITGHSGHPRFKDGLSMLMNRQLPHGGWNYGNTFVYGKELRPFVETTGIALAALAGHVAREKISGSLHYLQAQAEHSRTPLALAWALFGLAAWNEFPAAALDWIDETFKKQIKYGPYGTSLLSILAVTHMCRGNIRIYSA